MKIFDKQIILSDYGTDIKRLWQNVPDRFPDFLTTYDTASKSATETWITQTSETVQKQLQSCPKLLGRKRWREETQALFLKLFREAPILATDRAIPPGLRNAFLTETKRFLKQTRDFDKTLCLESIGQALRNYIVYGVFCILSDMPQHCHSAVWGYSMLYPYTDNYIDDPEHSPEDKAAFNAFIRHRLMGDPVVPSNTTQLKTGWLLDAIEAFYPRSGNTDIYDGLLMMLEAQEFSLTQSASASTEEEILDISIYKGGISVLLDRFFVEKEMNKDEIRFYLAYGLFLQLADDLQDISSDKDSGSRTVMNFPSDGENKEKVVNKLLHFLHTLLTTWFPAASDAVSPDSDADTAYSDLRQDFIPFLSNSCQLLILASVWLSREHFSESYLKKIEAAMPVSFDYMQQILEKQKEFENASEGMDTMHVLDVFLEDAFLP